MSAFQQWLADFSARESCDLSQLEDTAAIALEFNEGLSVLIEHTDDNYMILSAGLGNVASGDADSLELLLSANLLALESNSGTIGLDPVSRQAFLYQQIALAASTDTQSIQAAFDGFLAAAIAWRDQWGEW